MRENTYVRVFGNIRSFQNQRSLVAFKITPILDMNELTTHLLEVVHSHLWWTKSQVSLFSVKFHNCDFAPFIIESKFILVHDSDRILVTRTPCSLSSFSHVPRPVGGGGLYHSWGSVKLTS